MALRQIRVLGDEILTKPCREVKEITPRLKELIDDMLETMYEANGIGLAAPQVGVLRRIVVIDVWQEGLEELLEPEEPEASEEPADEEKCAEAQEPEDAETSAEAEDAEEEMGPLIMVNPVITRAEGEQTGDEGCLSLPGKAGKVTRPNLVEVDYFDENMEEYEIEAEGLLARAICHELDHLEGRMYVDLVEGELHDVGVEEPEDEEEPDGGEPSDAAATPDDTGTTEA